MACVSEVFALCSNMTSKDIVKDPTYQDFVSSDANDRGYILVAECGARPPNNVFQLLCGHLILFDKFGNHFNGDTWVIKSSPALKFLRLDSRESVWNKQSAIVSQTCHDNSSEVQVGLASTGG